MGVAGALLAITGALVALRRRRPAPRTRLTPAAPQNKPTPSPLPARAPLPAPAPPETRAGPTVAEPLQLTLEASRLSATLVNATLAYRLIARNAGAEPLADVAIGGDMIAAHASRPVAEQLGLTGAAPPPLHAIALLGPGETVALGGELRLPLASVLAIRHGAAHLFVPLARFEAWASAPAGRAVHARAAYLVGQPGGSNARLQPFRLDLGPRVYNTVGQRALDLPPAG